MKYMVMQYTDKSVTFFSISCKVFWLAFFPACLLFFNSGTATAGFKHQHTIKGKTMGTFYTVKYIADSSPSRRIWKEKIDTCLKQINHRMSMFDPDSELSSFNQSPVGIRFQATKDFFSIIRVSDHLYQLTHGAWDGTIKPLVDLWGFGTKKGPAAIPALKEIQAALDRVGFNRITISRSGSNKRTLIRQKAVTLDLGSIAKGYGVDAVVRLFLSSGIKDVLVEIGGELSGFGKNKKGQPWSVGISRPDKIFTGQTVFKIIRLDNQAIATSGNYRNFFEINGKTYSHIIDPETGFPVKNQIVSVSVISKNCTFADGLATALMVMDVDKGLALVNHLDDTECMIVQKKLSSPEKGRPSGTEPSAPGKMVRDKEFITHLSKNFSSLVIP